MSHQPDKFDRRWFRAGWETRLVYPVIGFLSLLTMLTAIWSAGIQRYDYAMLLGGWLLFIQAAVRAERHNDALRYRVSVLRRRMDEKDKVIRVMIHEGRWLLQPQGDTHDEHT